MYSRDDDWRTGLSLGVIARSTQPPSASPNQKPGTRFIWLLAAPVFRTALGLQLLVFLDSPWVTRRRSAWTNSTDVGPFY